MKDDRFYLMHIRDAVQRVLDYTRDGRDFFMSDTKTQDAAIRNIEIVGEAVKSLSDGLKSAHVDVPWKQIAGMRHLLVNVACGPQILDGFGLLASGFRKFFLQPGAWSLEPA